MGHSAKKVGVLALQGAFIEHIHMLERLEVEAFAVRHPQELEGVAGIIIPGGESTTIGRLLEEGGLRQPLLKVAQQGKPLWGTCAGMILLSRSATDLPFPPLGLMDVKVRRNAFGRQVDSFETDLSIPALGPSPFPAVFIRAPFIEGVGEGVEVLASLGEGQIVAARQGKLLATAFHPELTGDLRLHAYFLRMVD